jgi:hypothetical protein
MPLSRRLFVTCALLAVVAGACADDGSAPTEPGATSGTADATTLTAPADVTTTSFVRTGVPFVVNGERGAMARALQYLLVCIGYDILIDGAIGNQTMGAVAQYMNERGRESNGEPDLATFAEFSRACSRIEPIRFLSGPTEQRAGEVASGDDDQFRVDITAGQELTVELTSSDARAGLTIIGTDGTVLARNVTGEWTGTAPVTQTYRFIVGTGSESSVYWLDITIGEQPAAPSVTITVAANGSLLGVSIGSGAESAIVTLEGVLGDPTHDSAWVVGCTADGEASNERTVTWGSLQTFFYRDVAEEFVAWTYRLEADGSAASGGPGSEAIELPSGTEFGDPISEAAAALGGTVVLEEDAAVVAIDGMEVRSSVVDETGPVDWVGVPHIPACE